ncbi:MAG: HAMP domain-containing sensor histidine kinase [Gammaproteobacteria bacterium]|nr:HAMP domain-containing sensor histidine kinase [Gammaproteobacteria bacterium]
MTALGAEGAEAADPDLWDAAFYTWSVAALVFYCVTIATLRQWMWLSYGAWAALLLLLWSSLDGTLAYWLNAGEHFHNLSPLVIGSATAAAGYLLFASRLEPPHRLTRLRIPLLSLAALSLLPVPLYYLSGSFVPGYLLLNSLMMVMAIAGIFPPITWHTLSRGTRLLAMAWPVVFAAIVLPVYLTHFLGEGFTRRELDIFNRYGFLVYLSFALSFAVMNVLAQASEKREAERQAVLSDRRAADAALALERAEQAYEKTRQVASYRSRQLADASHDLKQPIAALRAAIDRQQRVDRHRDTERIREAVEYLDLLAASYGTDEQADTPESPASTPIDVNMDTGDPLRRESIPLSVLLDTVARMFEADALQRGVTLSVRPSTLQVLAPPLAVMRCLSNLVSNALQHAHAGKVLVGVRRRFGTALIVVADNGRGMSSADLHAALTRGAKGPDSPGSGLGLAIVSELAEQHDLCFACSSIPGQGTLATLTLPLTQAHATA